MGKQAGAGAATTSRVRPHDFSRLMVTAYVKMGKPEPPGKNKCRVFSGKQGSKSTGDFVKTDICQFFR
jgi:hypothetical protein